MNKTNIILDNMEYFKLLNLERSGSEPFILTSSGVNLLKKEPNFDKSYHIIGQCDQSGNLLDELSENNFVKKPESVPSVFKPKEVPSPKKDNGKSGTTKGNTAGSGEAKKKTGTKSGDDGLTDINQNPQQTA